MLRPFTTFPWGASFNAVTYWVAFVCSFAAAFFLLGFPSTTWAFAVLAVPPIAAILREKMGEKQKAAWVLVSMLLIVGVYRGLRKDQRDQEAAQQQIVRSFEKIGEQINQANAQNQQHFDRTLDSMKNITSLSSKALSTSSSALLQITGGGSFPYAYLDDSNQDIGIVDQGEYPLRDLIVQIMGTHTDKPVVAQFPVLTNVFAPVYQHNFYDADSHDLQMFFHADNGIWMETFQTRMVNRRLEFALRVIRMGPGVGQIKELYPKEIWCRVSDGYPLVKGVVEWNEGRMVLHGHFFKLPSVPCTRH